MNQTEHKLVIICFLFIIGNTYSCNLKNKPWCDTTHKNDVCPFGKDVINSYITLKNREIKKYNSSKEKKIGFRKSKSNKSNLITQWERDNTLDC